MTASGMEYPTALVQIQVLDDSTDDTRVVVDRVVSVLAARGVEIEVLRRTDRVGYKAGALQAAMSTVKHQFIAVFDADFVPSPEFLSRTLASFGPGVGMVQARWGHLNDQDSLLTQAQAAFLDGHFAVEHAARFQANRWFNFNGTAGVWRKEAIIEAGGWSADTITEDLDLSYRAQLAGWRFVYLDDLVAPAELPVTLTAFKLQQHRWAKGAVQTARKLLASVWRSPSTLSVKVEATIHLTSNIAYPLMVLLSLLLPLTIYARIELGLHRFILFDFALFLMTTASIGLYYSAAGCRTGGSARAQLLRVPISMALGIGMALSQSRAVFDGLTQHAGVFARTPKRGDGGVGHYRVSSQGGVVLELLMAAYLLVALIGALSSTVTLLSAPFLALFMMGYGYVGVRGLVEHLATLSPAPERAQPARGSR